MKTTKQTYDELKGLLFRLGDKDANVSYVMRESKKLIAENEEIEAIYLEQFKNEIEMSLDQLPFQSPQHISSDLRILIDAIKRKYNFD